MSIMAIRHSWPAGGCRRSAMASTAVGPSATWGWPPASDKRPVTGTRPGANGGLGQPRPGHCCRSRRQCRRPWHGCAGSPDGRRRSPARTGRRNAPRRGDSARASRPHRQSRARWRERRRRSRPVAPARPDRSGMAAGSAAMMRLDPRPIFCSSVGHGAPHGSSQPAGRGAHPCIPAMINSVAPALLPCRRLPCLMRVCPNGVGAFQRHGCRLCGPISRQE